MTNCCPHFSVNFCAITRAAPSLLPPGAAVQLTFAMSGVPLTATLVGGAPAGELAGASDPGDATVMGRVPVDVIYENALKTTLQLITLR